MSEQICRDCERAERELWPVYTQDHWCCRARMIVDASVSRSRDGVTLVHARRSMAEREKRLHPGDWERVRARLAQLAGKE